MCGIAGFSGSFAPELLTSMRLTMAHRGPDDQGEEVFTSEEGRIGLAHQRLSIIDLSIEGHEPMTAHCGQCHSGLGAEGDGLWLTYNGEIYNYRELRCFLQGRGHRFHSQTDAEVLLHLYGEEGPAMLSRLNGIFAFAIYDGRLRGPGSKQAFGDLFLARDGLGVKPLYYTETASGFLFASEIKALLASQEVPRQLDYVALHHYLAYLWAPAPRTMLSGVRKLAPGNALLVRKGRVAQEWTFYDLPYGQAHLNASEAEIAAELAHELRAAVTRQMVADVPVGAFLSGGLDSSAVVAMMRSIRPAESITCYTIDFADGDGVDGIAADLPYARQVADYLGVDLRTTVVQPDVVQNLEQVLYHLEEPQADPAAINTFLIAQQAQQDGIKVLLSGAGGDDIFSGYRRHWALQLERLWSWLPQGVRVRMAQRLGNTKSRGQAWRRRLNKAFAHADLAEEERLIAYFYWGGEPVRRSLYSAALADALAGVDTAEPLRESLGRIPKEQDRLNRMLYLEAKHFLADHNLNYTDKAGMAASVEIRVPLLDLDLVNFATRIPPALKQKGRMGKAIFKKAMEPYLPHNVIYRPKSGFGVPLRSWLHGEMRDLVGDLLSPDSLNRRGLFDPAAVQHLQTIDRTGQADAAYTIFSLLCIELWCRMFLDVAAHSI